MIVAVSGHRPEKIPNPALVRQQLGRAFTEVGAAKVIQGMAAGVDLWSARVAYKMGIPFICAKPWAGHKPRVADRFDYNKALELAEEVVNVDPSEEYPGPQVYQKRNIWMVDHADFVIAVWDGSSGGTANCVKYAQSQSKPMMILRPGRTP